MEIQFVSGYHEAAGVFILHDEEGRLAVKDTTGIDFDTIELSDSTLITGGQSFEIAAEATNPILLPQRNGFSTLQWPAIKRFGQYHKVRISATTNEMQSLFKSGNLSVIAVTADTSEVRTSYRAFVVVKK